MVWSILAGGRFRAAAAVWWAIAGLGSFALPASAQTPTSAQIEAFKALSPQQQQEIRTAIHDGQELVTRANAMTVDAQTIVTHIREGRGTVGALLMDEELYDDITEMVRDLKHNPWKLFWRE